MSGFRLKNRRICVSVLQSHRRRFEKFFVKHFDQSGGVILEKRKKLRSRSWWSDKIEEWRGTGLSIVAFCRHHEINHQTFYKWKTILKQEKEGKAKESITLQKKDQLRFVEVPSPIVSNPAIEIESPAGWKIRVNSHLDRSTLSGIIAALDGLA